MAYAPDLSVHELNHKVKMTTPDGASIKKKPVQCPRCTSEFKHRDFRSYTLHHLQVHLNLYPTKHSCPVCEYSCVALLNKPWVPHQLTSHFEVSHDLEGVEESDVKRCNKDGCSAYFLTYPQLGKHRLAVHLVEAGKTTNSLCTICGEQFYNENSLMSHRVNVHKVGLPVPCDVPSCAERFENEVLMNRHLGFGSHKGVTVSKWTTTPREAHVRRQTFYCLFCGIPFASPSILNQHQDDVHRKRAPLQDSGRLSPKQCLICKAPFGVRMKLVRAFQGIRQHYKSHHDVKGIDPSSSSSSSVVARCNMDGCEAYFVTHFQLKLHQRRVHFNGAYKCSSCDKGEFKAFSVLKAHRVKVHKVELNFACPRDGCDERFETQSDLEYHVDLIHKSRKIDSGQGSVHVCETCGRKFKLWAMLKSHKRSHKPKEERRFICSECGKTFKCKKKLSCHLMTHAGPDSWKFTCETCGKKCMTKKKLEDHQNVHTQAKPYTCEYCGLKYAHRHNFRHHLKDTHNVVLEKTSRVRTLMDQGSAIEAL